MAQKNRLSQAEKAAAEAKRKSSPPKKSTAKSAAPKAFEKKQTTESLQIPLRFITSAVCIALFVLFLVMLFNPDGALVKLFYGFVLGLIGRASFYIAIPALLYLFIIHAFSAKRPILMRSVCLISFVVICGCIYHLGLHTGELGKGLNFLANLYTGGVTGKTGGLICGSIAILLRWLCGSVISYIILIVAAVFTLLGAMQITVPSLVRAVENRPRADWESEEAREAQPEPAAIVVNHLATKRIQYVENRRRVKEEKANIDIPLDGEPKRKKQSPLSPKAKDMLRQIDEIETPVAAAEIPVVDEPVTEPVPTIFAASPAPVKPVTEEVVDEITGMPQLKAEEFVDAPVAPVAEPAPAKVTAKEAAASAAQVAAEIAEHEAEEKPIYCFPPIELLKKSKGGATDGTTEMRENTRRLNETLASFKIEAHIINVTRGPSVTRYEVELEKGVRLNKLTTVADDIALSLGASGVRIAAVPGKISVVGIEVPNRAVTTVSLREVIDSHEFAKAKSKSSFAVGKDIAGNCIVGNIAKLPHMLIAGTTGSGKSVCMNSIIISLLYKASPDDVKLIMVDPKMVELGIYNGIPHLLIPVVTDPKKAAGSLQWAVTEMMRRYKAMSDAGVRDLETYNSIIESEEDGKKLPQVVVIIDELADLMLVAAKEVEESICRIAQMGRAAGIHLIIATQRPSADVITGLMKANIPSRIAFAVASAMESRIILDTQGAEKLVGRGDMLFAPIGSGKPLRVQGCFVSDPEVEAVASYVKENYINSYDQSVMEEIERKAAQSGNGKSNAADPEPNADELDGDEMLPAAVDVILETGQASVSMLQRRLKLGYARAARIVDEMEEKGIVGPFQGSKPRTILITKDQWEAMKGGQGSQMDFDDIPFDDGVSEDF
jgi:S-DNA-T family DNA segregation ATPase FtsK/SpoIIIE